MLLFNCEKYYISFFRNQRLMLAWYIREGYVQEFRLSLYIKLSSTDLMGTRKPQWSSGHWEHVQISKVIKVYRDESLKYMQLLSSIFLPWNEMSSEKKIELLYLNFVQCILEPPVYDTELVNKRFIIKLRYFVNGRRLQTRT